MRDCERTGANPAAVAWYSALAQFKLAALSEYGRRRSDSPGSHPYFADPDLVSSFLTAAAALTTSFCCDTPKGATRTPPRGDAPNHRQVET